MDTIAFNELANRYFNLISFIPKQDSREMEMYFEGHAHGILTALYVSADHMTTADYDFWVEGIVQ